MTQPQNPNGDAKVTHEEARQTVIDLRQGPCDWWTRPERDTWVTAIESRLSTYITQQATRGSELEAVRLGLEQQRGRADDNWSLVLAKNAQLTTERARAEEAWADRTGIIDSLMGELAAANACIAEYKASEADWREQLRAANARVARLEEALRKLVSSVERCWRQRSYDVDTALIEAKPALSAAPQAPTEQGCPTADPIVGNDPSFDNQPVKPQVAQANVPTYQDWLRQGEEADRIATRAVAQASGEQAGGKRRPGSLVIEYTDGSTEAYALADRLEGK